jgi:hypothetical protein
VSLERYWKFLIFSTFFLASVSSIFFQGCASNNSSSLTGPVAPTPPSLTPAFYVATNGSDSNPGTVAAPFATLGACQKAMRGSSTKTCYVRGGTYSISMLPMVQLDTAAPTTVALKLTSADNGTTWSYYPPDGYNSAIFDGGNNQTNSTAFCQRTDMLDIGIYIGGAGSITVNGLAFQHFTFAAFLVHGGHDYFGNWVPTGGEGEGASNDDLIENNIAQNINNGPNPISPTNICPSSSPYTGFPNGVNTDNNTGGLLYAWGKVTNLTIANNVGINMMGECLDFEVNSSGDTFAGLNVNQNYCDNTGNMSRDIGAIHVYLTIGTNDAAPATGAVFQYNYLHDCGAAGSGEPGSSKCLYMDDQTSGITLTGNVMTGHFSEAAFIAHGGHQNTWTGNIVDLGDGAQGLQYIGIYQDSPHCTSGASCMTGNVWQNNIVIANSPIGSNGGYLLFSPDSPLTAQSDLDYEYGAGSITDGASVSSANPQLSGGNYILATSSPAYSSPVNFPRQPANWGQPGFWGPPGYVIPQIGTPPSCPH